LSIPYSRYIIYPVPWYSALIAAGVVIAIVLAMHEERRKGLPKDSVLDLALWVLPFGIIGARIYYVLFSLDQFRRDWLSVFRIWEGGIAIYGAVIAGLLVTFVFCRKRKLSFLTLCDVIAPGLVLAQCIGRWGNYFNMEAYGPPVTDPALCFFPLAVEIPQDGGWHLATFFYESLWDGMVFLVLWFYIRKKPGRNGDCFFAYLLFYGAGRLIIEEMRMDSLYSSSIRVSQLLSAVLCLFVLIYEIYTRRPRFTGIRSALLPLSLLAAAFAVFRSLFPPAGDQLTLLQRMAPLLLSSALIIAGMFSVLQENEVNPNADHTA